MSTRMVGGLEGENGCLVTKSRGATAVAPPKAPLRREREENQTPVTTAGLAGPTRIIRRPKTVGGFESLSYFSFGLPICRRWKSDFSQQSLVASLLVPVILSHDSPPGCAWHSWVPYLVWVLPLCSPQQHTDPSVCIMTRNSALSSPAESGLT